MTIKSSITWLTGTLLAIMILISGALMYLLNHSNDAFATTFHDRVIPLKQLKISADMFAVNVVDTIHKTNAGTMQAAQGSQSISTAEEEFMKQWQAYTSTQLTADEQKLIDQANGQISQALGVANEAKSLMQAGDMPGLKALADSKLYPAVDPLSNTISQLAELQLTEAEHNYNSSVTDLHTSTTFASLAIAAGLLIGIIITWRISRRLSRNVGQFQQTCQQIAKSRDLSLRVPTDSRDELAQIGQYLNELLSQFAMIIGDIRHSSQSIHQQSTQVDHASNGIMNSSKQQNDATATIASTIEQFAVSIAHVAESANLARQKADIAGKVTVDSDAALQETLREITAVGSAIRHSEQQVNALARQSQEITSILDVIRDVADQTNLLALNAAIEAARAGEMGRGFAVVADEVRKLAERTAQSTLQIDTMITAVSQSAKEATVAMQDSVERVAKGEALTASMQTAINQIRSEVSSVADSANDIADALAEQRQASNGIAHQVEQIAALSEENASNADALNGYAQTLSSQSQHLETKVRDFTV